MRELRRELTARLLDDGRLEGRKSQFFDGEAFWLDGKEVGHFGSSDTFKLRLTQKEIRRRGFNLGADSRITLHRPSSDWIVFDYQTDKDLDAIWELMEVVMALS